MTANRRRLGQAGEDAAARWYERSGYVVEARNWRCRDGELDLVACSATTLVVCEVKTRSTPAFGTGAEAVTVAKQARLRRLATIYLGQRSGHFAGIVRFDVASLSGLRVEVIQDAF